MKHFRVLGAQAAGAVLPLVFSLALLALLATVSAPPVAPASAPLTVEAAPRLSAEPEPLPGGGYRFTWSSVAGRRYVLQRWNGDDLSVTLSPTWLDVATVTASSSLTSADDPSARLAAKRFYRVVRLPEGVVPPATELRIAQPTVDAPSLLITNLHTLRFDVVVTHPPLRTIAAVDFYDGDTFLGRAAAALGSTYRFVAAFSPAQNGVRAIRAIATDDTGTSVTSEELPLRIELDATAPMRRLGLVDVRAAVFQTNGTQVTGVGATELGTLAFQQGTPVELDVAQGLVTGRGALSTPELGTVLVGDFTMDAATGWITQRVPSLQPMSLESGPTPQVIRLNPRTTLAPGTVAVHALSRDLRGSGRVEVVLDGSSVPLRLEGNFYYEASTHTLTLTGTLVQGSLRGTGTASVRLSDTLIAFHGTFQSPALLQASLIFQAGAPTPSGTLEGVNAAGEPAAGTVTADADPVLQATSDPTPAWLRDDADRFVPLGPDGRAIPNARVRVASAGAMPPFEFRPTGRSTLGDGQGLYLRFPSGARLITDVTPPVVAFTHVVAGFGPRSPLQFRSPRGSTLEHISAAEVRLTTGPLDVQSLLELSWSGVDDSGGLPVSLFGLALNWQAGVLTDGGVVGARFRLAGRGAPLPDMLGGIADFTLDLANAAGLEIPVQGSFSLGAEGPTIAFPPSAGSVLALRPDGSVQLRGQVKVDFPGSGGTIYGQLDLDPPTYRVQFSAAGLTLPMIGSLAQLMPAPDCIAAAPQLPPSDMARLDIAALCLQRFDRSLRKIQGVLAPFDAENTTDHFASESAEDVLGAVIEAWAQAKLAVPSVSPGVPLAELFEHAGRSASAAPSLHGPVAARLALERARQAGLREGTASAAFDAALAASIEAVVDRAYNDEVLGSFAAFKEVLESLLETERLLQTAPGRIAEPRIQAAVSSLVNRRLAQLAASQGVKAGEFRPVHNNRLLQLNAFQAMDLLAQVVDVLAAAQALGIEPEADAASAEMLGQLAGHLQTLSENALNEAERIADFAGFSLALQDYLELARIQQTGILPAAAGLRAFTPMSQLAQRLERLQQLDEQRPAAGRSLRTQIAIARRYVALLDAGLVLTAPSRTALLATFERLTAALNAAMPGMNAPSTPLTQALLGLEAGILAGRLREVLPGTAAAAFAWESPSQLGAVVEALRTRSLATRTSSGLHQAVRLLQEEAEHQKAVGQGGRRGYCLQQVQSLLEGSRQVAGQVMAQVNPASFVTDLLLPGELSVKKLAGAIRFDSATPRARADFSGELELPKFGLALTVPKASLEADGSFDLTAHGRIALPSASQPTARFSVPAMHPLHVSGGPGRLPRLSGEGKLEINGLTLTAQIALEDPTYAFAVSASGIRFDLADQLRLHVPALPDGRVLDVALTGDLNRSIRSLGAVYQTFGAGAERTPVASAKPQFENPGEMVPTAALDAVIDSLLANTGLGASGNYTAAAAEFELELQRIEQQAEESWETARTLLDYNRLARICMALQNPDFMPAEKRPALLGTLQNMLQGLQRTLVRLFNGPQIYAIDEESDLFYLASSPLTAASGPCFEGLGPGVTLELWTALVGFHDRTRTERMRGLGLDPGTGAVVPAVVAGVPIEQLYAGMTNMMARYALEQHASRETAGVYFNAVQSLGLEIRSRGIAVLRRIYAQTEFSLDDYRAVRTWSERLSRFMLHPDSMGLSYPENVPLPNSDGTASVYSREREQKNWQEPFDKAFSHALDELNAGTSSPLVKVGTYDLDKDRRTLHVVVRSHAGIDALYGLNEPYGLHEFRKRHRIGVVPPIQLYAAPPTPVRLKEIEADYARAVAKLGPTPRTEVVEGTAQILDGHLVRLRSHVFPAVGTVSLAQGLEDLNEICRTLVVAESLQMSGVVARAREDLSGRVRQWAASAAGQRAIGVATDVTELLQHYQGVLRDPASVQVVEAAIRDALASSLNLLNDLKLALPVSRPVDLQLPGDLVIQRAYGAIRYDRESGVFGGKVGGRLMFPEIKAWFDVTEASFDTQGRFTLKAGLASPTPFDGVRITARTTLSGQFRPNPDPLLPPIPGDLDLAFSGTGSVRLPGGAVFEADVGYDSTARTLSLTGIGANLNFTLGSQLAIFKAGGGIHFGGLNPRGNGLESVELRLVGSAGLFRNEKPAALPGQASAEDYHLVGRDVGMSLRLTETHALFKLTNGVLSLPEYFSAGLCVTDAATPPRLAVSDLAPTATRLPAQVKIDPAQPIEAELVLAPVTDVAGEVEVKSVRFSGSIGMENIGVMPSFARGFGAEICRGVLELPGIELSGNAVRAEQLPVLRIQSGLLQIPLPPGETNHVEVTDFKWRLDGIPTGEAALGSDLELFNQGGFRFALLGGKSCPGQDIATGVRVIENPPDAAGRPTPPTIELHGGVGFSIDKSLIRKDEEPAVPAAPGVDPNQISGKACGSIRFEPDGQPRFTLETLAVGGTFRLGGGGIRLQDASLSFEGIPNAFDPSEERPFRIGLNGTVYFPGGPGFGLRNSRFVFFDAQRPPRFEPGTLLYDQSDWKLANVLPIQVTNAAITFRDGRLGFPALFDPANVKIAVSARAAFPPQQPLIAGSIQDLEVEFLADGTPRVTVSSVSLALDPGLKIPPIDDIGGSLYVGGLDANPPNPFFVGKVGGSYQGYKLNLLLAFNLLGPVGLCLDVNAGPVGIPLDGGTVGFLLTGASGGMSFLNRFNDPSEFSAYMDPVTGRPVSSGASLPAGLPPVPVAAMDWGELRSFIERSLQLDEIFGPAEASAMLTTVVPPQGARAASPAARFASFPGDRIIEADEVSAAGADLDPGVAAASGEAAGATIGLMGDGLEIPCPGDCPPATVNLLCQPHPDQEKYPGKVITKFTAIPTETLAALGITAENIQLRMEQGANIAVETAHQLREQIDAGTPQPDAGLLGAERARRIRAIQVETFDAIETRFRDLLTRELANAGTASALHAAITNVAWAGLPCADVTFKVTGTFSHVAVSSVLSVTGGGTLSTTGSAGIGGQVNLFGLPVGKGSLYLSATDARGLPNPSLCGDIEVSLGPVTFGFMKAALKCDDCITGMLGVFTQCAASLAGETLDRLVRKVAPRLAGKTPIQLAAELSAAEKTAFFAELFQLPASSLPPNLGQTLVNALGQAYERLDPEFLFCGRAAPSLFGFPIIGDFGGAQMRVNKRGRDASFSFAPSQLLSAVISASFLPGFDTATFSVSQPFPDVGGLVVAGLSGGLASPEAIAEVGARELESMLVNGTFTAGYEFHPLGMKLARVQSRLINPDLVNHPVLRGANWRHPEDLGRGLPSRVELLQAAVRANLLGNALWKGSAGDLAMAYPDPASRDISNNVRGLSLVHDYFPHGGMVGAGFLDMPRALYDGVPPELINRALNPAEGAPARLDAVISIVSDYALKTVPAGNLSFYMPAPNPPTFRKPDGVTPLTAAELLRGIVSFDATLLAGGRATALYPIEESFMGGYLDGRFLGVPLANARLTYVPPGTTGEPFFQIAAGLAPDSWLAQFVDQASLLFDIRQSPTNTIEATFSALRSELESFRNSNPADVVAIDARVGRALDLLFRGLPKAKLEARLERFRMPRELQSLLNAPDGDASVSLFAYSPRFEPGHVGTGPVADVRRKGGMAMRGRFRVADLVTLDNAEFSVIPKVPPTGLPPAIAGRFQLSTLDIPGLGGTLMRNVGIDVNTEPAVGEPAVRIAGELSPIRIQPLLEIVPIPPATLLTGRVELLRSAPLGGSAGVRLSPARLRLPLFAPDASIWIDGGADNADFTFSTDPAVPWNARVRFENGLRLSVGGMEVFRYGDTRVTGAITNFGTGAGAMTLALDASQDITLFGSDPQFKRVIRLGGEKASLAIHSDGTFRLAGTLDRALDFSAIPGVGFQLAAGADFVLTQANFSFSLRGSTFGPYPGASAEGSLEINYGLDASVTPARLKIAANLAGSLSIEPIRIPKVNPVFQILPVDAGATRLSASFNNGHFTVDGAKVVLGKPFDFEAQIESFDIDGNGKFVFEKSLAAYRVGGIEFPSGTLVARNDPRLEVSVRGNLPSLDVGVFAVTSRIPGQRIQIDAALMEAADGAIRAGLSIGPARIAPPGAILSASFEIDGGFDGAGRPLPFTFSTDPETEWSAVVRYNEAVRLAAGDRVLLESGGLSSVAAFQGRGLVSGRVTFDFTPNSSFTVFPDDDRVRRTFIVDAAGGPARLTLGPGASFSASGSVGGFDLPGLFRVPGGAFALSSSPASVSVRSSGPGLDLLGFGLLPVATGGSLDASFEAGVAGGVAFGAVSLAPARLVLPSLLPSSPLKIHGGSDANGQLLPLRINADPAVPFSAQVTQDRAGDLDFSLGDTTVVRYASSSIGGLALDRDGGGVVRFTLRSTTGARVIFMPGKPFAASVTLDPASDSRLTVGSDGRFSASYSIPRFDLAPAPFTLVSQSGGSLTVGLDNNGLQLPATQLRSPGLLAAGVNLPGIRLPFDNLFSTDVASSPSPTLTVAGFSIRAPSLKFQRTAAGQWQLTLGAGTTRMPWESADTTESSITGTVRSASDFSLTAVLNPLVLGPFKLESTDVGGQFSATLQSSGFRLDTGTARLRFVNDILCTFALADLVGATGERGFVLPATGNFEFAVAGKPFKLGGFDLGNSSFAFRQIDRIASLNLKATVFNLPGNLLDGVSLSGDVNADQTFLLRSSVNLAFNAFNGFPVNGLASAQVTLKRTLVNNSYTTRLSASGTLSGGVLSAGILPAATAVSNAELTLGSAGIESITADVTFPAIDAGIFHLRPTAPATQIGAKLDATGLTLNAPRLTVDGLFTAVPPAGVIKLAANGDFSVSFAPNNLPIAGVPWAGVGFTLARAGGVWSLDGFKGQRTVPGFGGMFNIDNRTIRGLADFSFSTDLPALDLGPFHIKSISAKLDAAKGLRVTGGQLSIDQLIPTSIGLPDIPVNPLDATGGFNLPVSLKALPLLGFNFEAPSFNLVRSGNTLSIVGMNLTLPKIFGFASGPVRFGNGIINSSGVLSLDAVKLPALPLGVFNLESMTASLTPSGLSITGGELVNPNLFNRRIPIGSVAVPATLASDSFVIDLTPGDLQLLGYPLKAVSFSLLRSGDSFSLGNFGADLGFSALVTQFKERVFKIGVGFVDETVTRPFRIDGTIDRLGTVALRKSLIPNPLTTQPQLVIGGMPIDAGGNVRLNNKDGLKITASLGVKNLGFSLDLDGSVTPGGDYSLVFNSTAPFFGLPVSSGTYTLSGSATGSARLSADVKAGFSGTHVNLNILTLRGALATDGSCALDASSPGSFSVGGFEMTDFKLRFLTVAGSTLGGSLYASGIFTLGGVGYPFNGGYSISGSSANSYFNFGPANLTLGGFTATDGRLNLTNGTMRASGAFRIGTATDVFNANAAFAGTISSPTAYNLGGNAGFRFGPFEVQSGPVLLTSTGVAPNNNAPLLPFGGLQFPLTFRIDSGGVASLSGSQSRNIDWTPFVAGPGVFVWVKLDASASLSATTRGAISGRVKGTFYYVVGSFKPTVAIKNQQFTFDVQFPSTGVFSIAPPSPIEGLKLFEFRP